MTGVVVVGAAYVVLVAAAVAPPWPLAVGALAVVTFLANRGTGL